MWNINHLVSSQWWDLNLQPLEHEFPHYNQTRALEQNYVDLSPMKGVSKVVLEKEHCETN